MKTRFSLSLLVAVIVVIGVGITAIFGVWHFATSVGTSSSVGVDKEFQNQVTQDVTQQINERRIQCLFPSMKPIAQPQGYNNLQVRFSSDKKYAAFLSKTSDSSNSIIVRNMLQAGTDAIVPAPSAAFMLPRHPWPLGWGADSKTLYVVESATTGERDGSVVADMPIPEMKKEFAKEFNIIYAWTVGDAQVSIVEQTRATVMAMGVSKQQMGILVRDDSGYSLRRYSASKFLSSESLNISVNGKELDCNSPQLLLDRNELWFWSSSLDPALPDHPICMLDLSVPESQPVAGIHNALGMFAWLRGEQKMLFCRYEDAGERNIDYLSVDRGSMGQPTILFSLPNTQNTVHPELAGISSDGSTVYFSALANAEVNAPDNILPPGAFKIFSYPAPQ
jgi:hypothetical protein